MAQGVGISKAVKIKKGSWDRKMEDEPKDS